jgi:hypothetical protein
VNGKEQVGDPTKYQLKDNQYIVIAFLPDSKKIATLGKPPSYKNLPGAEGSTNSTPTTTSTSASAPTTTSAAAPTTTAPSTPTS